MSFKFLNKLNKIWPSSRKTLRVADYWEDRYRHGGTSGAGSYGRLAKFKASVLNEFVEENGISRVLEIGCGDGNQLSLSNYPRYVGLDISAAAVELCRKRFERPEWDFYHYSSQVASDIVSRFSPQLMISLDVIFHLVEDAVYESYMRNLFCIDIEFSPDYVIVYSSNGNFSVENVHTCNRVFTKWVERHASEWRLVKEIKNPFQWDPGNPEETSFSNFFIFRK